MKKLISLLLLSLYALSFYATPRSESESRALAIRFLESQNMRASLDVKLVRSTDAVVTRFADTPAFYIYNIGNEDGFVIVSGDDCAKEILAYSYTGSIDPDFLPSNMKYWLDFYNKEIAMAASSDHRTEEQPFSGFATNTRADEDEIEPLLGNIKWNQGNPYNKLCPMESGALSVTGCVATAMAMVMKYHSYPTQGTGSHSYVPQKVNQTLSANFGATTYQWDKMLPGYNGNETAEEIEAVATLMYHCGVSVEMDYSSKESGAIQANIQTALIKYFGYNPYIRMIGRDYCSLAQWVELIKEELRAGRPIPYNGQSDRGGHSFILDGYDKNGKFHFNWGWGGSADGYYEITSLSPGAGGIGSGGGSYDSGQHIMLRVQPDAVGTFESYFEIAGSLTASGLSFGREDNISATCAELWNFTPGFKGVIGLALYDKDKFITFLSTPLSVSIEPGRGWRNISFKGKVPANVSNGEYMLYVAAQHNEEEAPRIIKAPNTTFSYYKATITSSNITLKAPDTAAELQQKGTVSVETNPVCQNREATFSCTISNQGAEFYDEIGIYIRKVGALTYQRISTTANIAPGEEKLIRVTGLIELAPGTYKAVGSYKQGTTWKQFSINDFGTEFEVHDYSVGVENIEKNNCPEITINSNGNQLQLISAQPVKGINIYDQSGKIVNTIRYAEKQWNPNITRTTLPKGLCVLVVETDKGIHTLKHLNH